MLPRAFRIHAALRTRRWQLPIILPVAIAMALVVGLAIQSIRSAQVHRRAVVNALRDYASFAAWQYTRRASDYLRLSIVTELAPQRALTGVAAIVRPRIECRFDRDVAHTTRSRDSIPISVVDAALAEAVRRSTASRGLMGLVTLGETARPRYLAYRFWRDSSRWSTCSAMVVEAADLHPIFEHVAGFAPLLPPTLVGGLPNDSLVSIQVRDARGPHIDSIGASPSGISATDILEPDLADLQVIATLHPAATERLVAGGMPASNAPALIAMLVVAIILCGVAVVQLRRTQEVIRLRDDFVASVSHELKTPLTQISLFADTLAAPQERSREERRRYLTIISREAVRLGHLVDGMLHFAGMTRSPSATVHSEPSFLGEEIRAAVAAFEPLADARNASIQLRIENEVELLLDRDAFRQVMLNLLDNSLKFGPDGQEIVVRVTSSGRNALITVDDEGPGVPPDERERAFEAFVRTRASGNKTGSGIGLAVVREVIRRYGGDARLDSSPSGGARVEIRLPATHVMTANTVPGVE